MEYNIWEFLHYLEYIEKILTRCKKGNSIGNKIIKNKNKIINKFRKIRLSIYFIKIKLFKFIYIRKAN